MNLKLFQQECSKRILIVLRDFDSKRNQRSKIENLILQDINKIWGEIKKPEKYKDSQPSNFFEFEFITLPHKKYFEAEFDAEIMNLRGKLFMDNKECFFRHVKSEKNIPADGIKHYIQQVWDDIVNEKELNIPSQKEMLSSYRCNEIKDAVLGENDQSIKEIIAKSGKERIEGFKGKCLSVYDVIMKQYDEKAANYVENIYQGIRKQLENNVSQKFYMCFANQAKRLVPISQKFMRQDIEKELKSK